MTYKPTAKSTDVPVSNDGKVRTILLIVGLLIYSAFVYGSGMEAEIRKARVVNEQRKVVEQEYRDAQRTGRQRIAAVEQLEARRQVALALDALDKRNFGTAQDALKQAASLLDQAQSQQTSNPDLADISQSLKSLNLVATTEIGAQRDGLMAVAGKMDAAFGGFTDGFIKQSVADDTAHPIKAPTMNDIPSLPGTDKGSDLTTGQDYRK